MSGRRAERRPVFTIRPAVYRGKSGYTIKGPRASIFVFRRITAEAIRDLLRAGGSGPAIDRLIRADAKAAAGLTRDYQRAPLGTSSRVAGTPVRIVTSAGDRLIRKATR